MDYSYMDDTPTERHDSMNKELSTNSCPFCTIDSESVVAENDLCYAVRDLFPVNPGHTLIIPKRHFRSWFDATPEEYIALASLMKQVREALDEEFSPDAYNIGVNEGTDAGQTVMHLHIHFIPRYRGDVDDVRGGVRAVIAAKRRYPS